MPLTSKGLRLRLIVYYIEVSGPEDTPYFGGTFKIDIQIPER